MKYDEVIDNDNDWTSQEIEEIKESLKEYAEGNYKTFSNIDELLTYLHSK